MKKFLSVIMALLIVMTSAFTALVCLSYGAEEPSVIATEDGGSDEASGEDGASKEAIATEDETTARNEVGEPGMVEVSGKEVKDGEYDIKVDSDSGMFNIVSTKLTVKSGEMTAVITLHGDGYKAIYQGTPEEAVDAQKNDSKTYEKNLGEAELVDGDYTYEIPVPSLNSKVNVSALSKKYNKWYPHQLVFRADSLPEDAVTADLDRNKLDVEDGEYTIEVELSGGTGRATVTSPAKIVVEDGVATASIEWSSPNYDYMIVNGDKFLPQNGGEGNSLFEIPVTCYDEPMQVTADTTAMSTPHEIEYELTFKRDTVKGASPVGGITDPAGRAVVAGLAAAIVIGAMLIMKRRKRD